jgi:hypothetical protein
MTRHERQLLAEVEASPFAWEVRELVRIRGRYEGLASWVLQVLSERAQPANRSGGKWPKTPNQAGQMLNKLAAGLELKGVKVSYRRHGLYGRLWCLERQTEQQALVTKL